MKRVSQYIPKNTAYNIESRKKRTTKKKKRIKIHRLFSRSLACKGERRTIEGNEEDETKWRETEKRRKKKKLSSLQIKSTKKNTWKPASSSSSRPGGGNLTLNTGHACFAQCAPSYVPHPLLTSFLLATFSPLYKSHRWRKTPLSKSQDREEKKGSSLVFEFGARRGAGETVGMTGVTIQITNRVLARYPRIVAFERS